MYRYGQEEIDAAVRAISSKKLFKINEGGQEVFHFEQELKEKFGVDHAILMTSGKAGIMSALIGIGVGPGDEVIVPAYTYIATAIAVTAVGAIPVIAEVDETLTLDPEDVEKKISAHTKAILPVHILGLPCNMDRIMAIAAKHNLYVVEDSCQADGATYHGKRLGTIGNAGAYSFNCFKIIGAGEGGGMVTNDRKIFERALIFQDSSAIAYFGNQMEDFETEQFCGLEFRVSDITGAIMRAQLKKLDSILHDLRKNRDYIMENLSGKYRFLKYNDKDGSAATNTCFWFDTAEEALAFKAFLAEKGYNGVRPIDTGKHVYANWTPIMQKNGASHPLMDPFKMEANRGLQHNYSPDMCPKSLDYMARMVYVGVNPDAQKDELDTFIRALFSKGTRRNT